MEQWVGCNALVTGASSGIGAATAKKFIEAGINVIGIARRLDRLEELSQQISTDETKFYPLQCDVTNETEILGVFEWIEANVGPISILFNNAGTLVVNPLGADGDLNIWKRTLYTNCLALSIFTREAIRVMKAHDIDGLIINNSSIAARYVPNHPLPNSSPNVYPATKFAVNALSNTLTNELRHEKSKIRVSCVSPGLTLTEIFRYEPPEVLAAVGDSIPFLTSENIADSVMFILSTPPDVQVISLIVPSIYSVICS
ncbi:farnesol dehydrogenase-like [Photinus pyralis]|uniref:farnesol dehydrogenase-like n=1 Tax=Photinus pyralis TaxID=7054 RepID=UPI0012672E89|nr:farnesol dehydrogenase-like [Photinus pyralis]